MLYGCVSLGDHQQTNGFLCWQKKWYTGSEDHEEMKIVSHLQSRAHALH